MPTYTHGKSTRREGSVCGEPGPVTDDPTGVTCSQCDDYADIDAMPDDATSGDASAILAALRAARDGQWRKVDGIVLDMTTANAVLTVHDKLSAAGQAKLLAMPLVQMVNVTWKLLRPKGEGEL